MVLVKMLMEIDPLPMSGSLVMVMVMVMISPSRREVPRKNSSVGALDWFRLVAAESRPEKFLLIFFSSKDFI